MIEQEKVGFIEKERALQSMQHEFNDLLQTLRTKENEKNLASQRLNFLKEKDPETQRPYSLRYVGTLVADFHRTLINGGIFMYPASPKPKLRLLYEAAPLAMVAEQAGGKAITGRDRVLEIVPTELHQKVPLVVGSADDVARYQDFFLGGDGPQKAKAK